MNSGHIGERSIFNHSRHVQNGKVKKINFSVGDIVLVLQDERVCNQ